MPIVNLRQEGLFKNLGRSYTPEEFDELCFDYGLELDEITSEREMIAKEQGDKKAEGASDAVIYKVEVPANRYDLLCVEGLTRALMIFLNVIEPPLYTKKIGELQVIATRNVLSVRPFVVGAVLRDIKFDQERYQSFIDLQDKLHQNICRKRSLVAIGTHDLDTIKGPFRYDALPPKDIKFKPLNETREFTAVDLMEHYSKDSHLKPYLPIIRDCERYPVIFDSNNIVLSMPPIINGDHSKISISTKNVFIECTATDLNKAKVVLDTVVTMFSQYCEKPFTVESVSVTQGDGTESHYPILEYSVFEIDSKYISGKIGVDLNSEQCNELLGKMSLRTETVGDNKLRVNVPPTRHDILHPCDIMEDVAVAYGFNNIEEKQPTCYCVAEPQKLNHLTDLLRHEMANLAYTECLTFSLCSRDDVSKNLRKNIDELSVVHISNPKTLDFQVVRSSLLPGLLRTLYNNQSLSPPLQLFEIQDIVLRDCDMEVLTRNHRQLCCVRYAKDANFEKIHGMCDRIMKVLNVYSIHEGEDAKNEMSYALVEKKDASYFDGRCASIVVNGQLEVGTIGVLHPEVLEAFGIKRPCCALELNVEHFL